MKTKITFLIMLAFIGLRTTAQITFQKLFTGSHFNYGFSIQQTSDSGYIFTGTTQSYGIGNSGDVYLIKTNKYGDTLWTRTYGGTGYESGYSVLQTTDGGYIITGTTNSFGTDSTLAYIIKTNSLGDTLWTKIYGGIHNSYASCIKQTSDGGYIIVGGTNSYGADSNDVYLIKINHNGDSLWTKTFGGLGNDYGNSIQITTDGGYIITGTTSSFGAGGIDVYLIRTDSIGDTLFTKTYGGSGNDYGESVLQTNDGGFIIAGYTFSFGAGLNDIYIIKTNSNGDTLWTKTYGGTNRDGAYSIQKTNDGGYIIAGWTVFGAGNYDYYLVKINSVGTVLWTKTYGGALGDNLQALCTTNDGGFVMIGEANSFGSNFDIYLIKTDSLGNSRCHEGTLAPITNSSHTIVLNTTTQIHKGGIVNSSPTIVGRGGNDSILCRTQTDINEITYLPSVHFYPNPFSSQATLTLQGSYHSPTLFIYNLMGQEVRSIPIGTNQEIIIQRGNLPAGMYFYKVVEATKEVVGVGKVVLE